MNKVVLAGGSGFLGQALAESFCNEGVEVVILSRGSGKKTSRGRYVSWDAQSLGEWTNELEGADIVINLTGRSVDCRYTKVNRDLILNSRVDSTRILGEAISQLQRAPKTWLNASTATIYNDCRGSSAPHDETSEGNAKGFSEDVGRAWEKTFLDGHHEGVRQIAMRISFVLGPEDGAFPVLRRFAKLGLGGAQGPGTQWMSWLHIDDWVGIVRFLIENESINGPVNLTAPNPVTNAEFMKEMRKHFAPLGIGLPAPSFAVHIGAVFLGTAPELVLKSRKVVSRILKDNSYNFKYPTLDNCLQNLQVGSEL